MVSLVRHVTVDCLDAPRVAAFWAAALGAEPVVVEDNPGDFEVTVTAPGIALLFVPVPRPKTVKNRVHLDLQPQDRGRDAEVRRLLALGATLVDDRREPDGTGWCVLADVEGNEFCVERSAAERAATGSGPRRDAEG
ncbi:VOC family protein [Streptacidiphilus sp. P02-A3a]|uniref:VOC family protein n=1 Tax=Streptacidiphilus sp. P02-A3a TaxID=2704468 RepID=UPI0015FDE830|nr:VOC family protein [Streptacidiphilus sp. P02-A3a]QMU72943.1 VOC family protein [Streptacidiphilus sp. P02-A3a]